MRKNILILPGDGIGPEIVAEAVKVLELLKHEGEDLSWSFGLLGGAAVDAEGSPYPETTQQAARAADAILMGAVGGPKYDDLPRELRPERGILGIRKDLGLFANLRPALAYEALAAASSFKPEIIAGLDILILRELTGDIYFGQPRGRRTNADGEDEGFDTMHYARSEIERRQGERARHLAAVARGDDGSGAAVSRRGADPHVRRQCRHAAGQAPQTVRRDGHRQHLWRHPVG